MIGDSLLPPEFRRGLAILNRIQDPNIPIDPLSKKFLMERNPSISLIYQTQILMALLQLTFLGFIFAFFTASTTEVWAPMVVRISFVLCAVCAIRYRLAPLSFIAGVCLHSMYAVSTYTVFYGCENMPAAFCYYSRAGFILPLVVNFLVGTIPSYFTALLNFIVLGLTVYLSLDKEYTIKLTWESHSSLLVYGCIQTVLPLLMFLAFEKESRIHRSILTKLLNESENKSEAKTKFISRMSHELRTPLHGMLSSTALLKQTGLTEEQSTYISTIDSCGELLLDIVVKILDLTKIESGKFEIEIQRFSVFDLVQHVTESLSVLAEKKGVALYSQFDLRNFYYDVEGDQKHIREILVNLVGNALKFTPKGHVTISIKRVTITPPGGEEPQDVFRFEVEDTGLGIPSDLLNELFNPFIQGRTNQKKSEGTGLGLSISKTLVEALGGTIGVSSVVGKGSIFWINVPLKVLPLGTIYPSLEYLPIKAERLRKVRVGVHSVGRGLTILENYLNFWKIPYRKLDVRSDLRAVKPGTFTHLILDAEPDDNPIQILENYVTEPTLILCALSSFHLIQRDLQKSIPLKISKIMLGIKPFSPIKLSHWLMEILHPSNPSDIDNPHLQQFLRPLTPVPSSPTLVPHFPLSVSTTNLSSHYQPSLPGSSPPLMQHPYPLHPHLPPSIYPLHPAHPMSHFSNAPHTPSSPTTPAFEGGLNLNLNLNVNLNQSHVLPNKADGRRPSVSSGSTNVNLISKYPSSHLDLDNPHSPISAIPFPTPPRSPTSTVMTSPSSSISTSLSSPNGLQVLVVEDNHVNQMVMGKQLEKLKVSFKITPSGDEALEIWEKANRSIALIFLDVEIDGSLNGLQVCSAIRQRERELDQLDRPSNSTAEHRPTLIRSGSQSSILKRSGSSQVNFPITNYKSEKRAYIAIMTGRGLEEDRREALHHGCDDFLIKPVPLEKIKDLVVKFV